MAETILNVRVGRAPKQGMIVNKESVDWCSLTRVFQFFANKLATNPNTKNFMGYTGNVEDSPPTWAREYVINLRRNSTNHTLRHN